MIFRADAYLSFLGRVMGEIVASRVTTFSRVGNYGYLKLLVHNCAKELSMCNTS